MNGAEMRRILPERLAPAERLGGDRAGGLRGDFELNSDFVRGDGGDYKLAAVLVPLVDRPQGVTILMTQRTAHLRAHAGQISFPGGRAEPRDENAVATALRETVEELGLDGERVEVMGRLDTYETGTGYSITPVVGVLVPGFSLAPDPAEVEEVFEVPLAFVLDPANHRRHSRYFNGIERHFHAMPFEGRYIWGATAGMLVDLYEKISG